MIGAWLGIGISVAAVLVGAVQLRRGDVINGRLAVALGLVGVVFNLYALFML